MTRSEELLGELTKSVITHADSPDYYYDDEVEQQLRTRLIALEAVLEKVDYYKTVRIMNHLDGRAVYDAWGEVITAVEAAKEAK